MTAALNGTATPLTRTIVGAAPQLGCTVGRLARGPHDPSMRRVGQVWWRASATPEGPVLLRLVPRDADVEISAWGPGSDWALEQSPRLLGQHDDTDFDPRHPLLSELQRRNPHLRVGATDRVAETLLPVVIEQKVTGAEAFRAIFRLIRSYADLAPGPAGVAQHPASGMRVPLTAEQWAAIPSWVYLRAGVEQKRSATLVGAARRASALERTLTSADAHAALCSLPGIGPWTSGVTRQIAHGDPDAWSVGDYHIPGYIGRVLLGRPPIDDAEVDAVLEPFRGHRYRVQQLVMTSGVPVERHGPRRSLPTHLPHW